MTYGNIIQVTADAAFRALGGEKHSGSWYVRSDETIAVANLQKSQYSVCYYLNIGFWFPEIEDVQFPKSEKCHCVGRAGLLDQAKRFDLDRMLDLEAPMSDERRVQLIDDFVNEVVSPVFDMCRTVDGLKKLIAEGEPLQYFLVRAAAVDLLGLS
jgi:hypothetical protein